MKKKTKTSGEKAMNFTQELGLKIKELRLNEKLTLVECSEYTGLSVGFLSQIENGKTSISIDNLYLLAKCLGVEISYFFETDEKKKDIVITRNWNYKMKEISEWGLETALTDEEHCMTMLPTILTLLPEQQMNEEIYRWDGDVFFYVIDGIFTLKVEDQTEELYPCDAAHFSGKTGYTYWNSSPFTTHVFCAKKKSE